MKDWKFPHAGKAFILKQGADMVPWRRSAAGWGSARRPISLPGSPVHWKKKAREAYGCKITLQ